MLSGPSDVAVRKRVYLEFLTLSLAAATRNNVGNGQRLEFSSGRSRRIRLHRKRRRHLPPAAGEGAGLVDHVFDPATAKLIAISGDRLAPAVFRHARADVHVGLIKPEDGMCRCKPRKVLSSVSTRSADHLQAYFPAGEFMCKAPRVSDRDLTLRRHRWIPRASLLAVMRSIRQRTRSPRITAFKDIGLKS